MSWNGYIDTCTVMFILALFTIASVWKQPKCLSQINNENITIHNGIWYRLLKHVNSVICDMNEFGEHYADKNKSHTERQIDIL